MILIFISPIFFRI